MSHKVIPVEDEFNNPVGQFEHYDAYDTGQRFALPKQRHIDIRNFNVGDESVTLTMIHLDRVVMGELDSKTMLALESGIVLLKAEQWTNGTTSLQTDRNNWQGLTLQLSEGINQTSSVIER